MEQIYFWILAAACVVFLATSVYLLWKLKQTKAALVEDIITNKTPYECDETEMIRKIDDAFANDEFKMYLQFIVDSKTGKIASAEALSRWESAGEIISPAAYIEVMERSGRIAQLDYYMFEKACKKLSEWQGTEFEAVSLSCNFTRITISEKEFVATIQDIADKYVFDRHQLLIEITEDAMEKNMDAATHNISKIKEMGFCVALDDIGRGYTSFSNLCEYPIDVVKIDRDILLLASEERGKKLFSGIVSLAHNLILSVVCEGVETEEQKALVTECNCDYIQGWYYFKALPEHKAEAFAKEYMAKCG